MVRLQRRFWKTTPLLLMAALAAASNGWSQHFYPDDPITHTPEVEPPGQAGTQEINALYDFAVNSIHYKTPEPSESLATNTLGEVPDSSWFTNRRGGTKMTLEQLQRGPREHGGPMPPYTVVAAKTEGVTPGFRIRDGRGLAYFVKVDPDANPEMATSADVIGALLLYAAGYNVPENYILQGRREEFQLAGNATVTGLSGKKRRMTPGELNKVLDAVPVRQDGKIRVMASLLLPGKVIGPFRYSDVRTDDPNDLIAHQRRRDLRGLAVLCAWINHTDAKGENSMDVLPGKGADARVKHYLLDFGDSFGSDSDIKKDPRHGQEYLLPASRTQLNRTYTFGLKPADWERVHYPHELPAVGNFTALAFDPKSWKPNYPNPAFSAMTPQDAYWAAKTVMSFSNEEIRAIVQEGKFSSPEAAQYIAAVLEQRRDAIGRAWLEQVLPLEDFQVEDGRLTFTDLRARYKLSKPETYRYSWFQWDNEANKSLPVNADASAQLPASLGALADGAYIGCKLLPETQDARSVTVYFRNNKNTWKLVGITRAAR
jgi:hypothetical protein